MAETFGTGAQQDMTARVRELRRSRKTLTSEETAYLDRHGPEVDALTADEFTTWCGAARERIAAWWQRLDLTAAYEQLVTVQPTLEAVVNPTDCSRQYLSLDAQAAVAFDTARDAQALLSYVRSMTALWRVWWAENAVVSSRDAAEEKMLLATMPEQRIAAELTAFLTFYDVTRKRVLEVAATVSRCQSLETDVWNYTAKGQYLAREQPPAAGQETGWTSFGG